MQVGMHFLVIGSAYAGLSHVGVHFLLVRFAKVAGLPRVTLARGQMSTHFLEVL